MLPPKSGPYSPKICSLSLRLVKCNHNWIHEILHPTANEKWIFARSTYLKKPSTGQRFNFVLILIQLSEWPTALREAGYVRRIKIYTHANRSISPGSVLRFPRKFTNNPDVLKASPSPGLRVVPRRPPATPRARPLQLLAALRLDHLCITEHWEYVIVHMRMRIRTRLHTEEQQQSSAAGKSIRMSSFRRNFKLGSYPPTPFKSYLYVSWKYDIWIIKIFNTKLTSCMNVNKK